MDDAPLVSVIMGAYNCKDTVINAIQSIKNQTYQNWEFIICDDCSTDGTYDILKKCAAEDFRIKLLHNGQNRRLAYSLNECLKIAKGKYVARMDADDESFPKRLERQADFLETHSDIDVVGCAMQIVGTGYPYIRKNIEYPTKKILLKRVPHWHPTIMMRKKVYDELGGYSVSQETMRAEDLDLWFRFYASGHNGYNIQDPLYNYHESITDYKKRTLKAAFKTAKVYLKGYKLLKFRKLQYIFALHPIVSAIIPKIIMQKYHSINNKNRM